jgi:cytochrome b
MPIKQRIRAYHAVLVVLVIAAYASGELGLIHAWLGYAIAVVIAGRLVAAATGVRQLGLMRFYPEFAGLKLGNAMTHPTISRTLLLAIAFCLISVTGTGIALDRGRSLKMAVTPHEVLANLLVGFVGLHVAYLLVFKFPLARFMLFLDAPKR